MRENATSILFIEHEGSLMQRATSVRIAYFDATGAADAIHDEALNRLSEAGVPVTVDTERKSVNAGASGEVVLIVVAYVAMKGADRVVTRLIDWALDRASSRREPDSISGSDSDLESRAMASMKAVAQHFGDGIDVTSVELEHRSEVEATLIAFASSGQRFRVRLTSTEETIASVVFSDGADVRSDTDVEAPRRGRSRRQQARRYVAAITIGVALVTTGVLAGAHIAGSGDGTSSGSTITVNAISRCGMTAAYDALATVQVAKGSQVQSVACPMAEDPGEMLVVASGGEQGRAQTIHLFERDDDGWAHADSITSFAKLEAIEPARDDDGSFVERGGVSLGEDPECCPTGRYRRVLSIGKSGIASQATLASVQLPATEHDRLRKMGANVDSDQLAVVDVTRDGLADALYPTKPDGSGTWRIAARPDGEHDGAWKVIGELTVGTGGIVHSAERLEALADLFVVPSCEDLCGIDEASTAYRWNGRSLESRKPTEAELGANACDTAAGQHGWVIQARGMSCGDAVRAVEVRHSDSLAPPEHSLDDEFECFRSSTHYESSSYACFDMHGENGFLYVVGV